MKRILLPLLGLLVSAMTLAANPFEDTQVKTRFAANLELWWDRQMPFSKKIEKAHELGFQGIEFWNYKKQDVKAIAEQCRKLGLDVVQFTAWSQPLGSGERIDAFEAGIAEALEAAEVLNCQKMTVTGHRWVEGYSLQEQLAHYEAALRRVAPMCEAAGVMIIIEPFNPVDHGKNILNGSQAAVEICRRIGSPAIKINWDFYHMQLTEGALITHLRNGYDQVGYLQLADTPGRFQPGTGELNYREILKAAWELGYRDYVGVECRTEGSPKEALEQLLANAF